MIHRFLLVLCAILLSPGLRAQDAEFTFQGSLVANGVPAAGPHDFVFTLFDAPVGGVVVAPTNELAGLLVADGLFTAILDFSDDPFDGSGRYLEIGVRPGGSAEAYTVLSPRQKITVTPYALTAANLMSTGSTPLDVRVNGARALRLEPVAGAPNFIGGAENNAVTGGAAGAAIGGGGMNTNAGAFAVIGGGAGNRVAGGFAVVSGGSSNVANGLSTVISGGARNTIGPDAEGATIGGGLQNLATDRAATIGGGSVNRADGLLSTVSGGYRNVAEESYSFVGGGGLNAATGMGAFVGGGGNSEFFVERGTNNSASGEFSVVVGGKANTASGRNSFVGGGRINIASGDGAFVGGGQESAAGGLITNNVASGANAVVAGGRLNVADGDQSAISGGEGNRVAGDFATAIGSANTVAGGYSVAVGFGNDVGGYYSTAVGYQNIAAGNYSLAAGTRARTSHQGAYVWADSSPGELFSASANSVTLRAAGGYRLFSNGEASIGASLAPDQNSWAVISDRKRKKDIQPLDSRGILDKLVAVPISTWHYDFEPPSATPHIGPMAQDFKAAFFPGRDDQSITTHEFDGVALAAIQGLNEKVEAGSERAEVRMQKLEAKLEQKEAELTALRRQHAAMLGTNAELLRRLDALEQRLK